PDAGAIAPAANTATPAAAPAPPPALAASPAASAGRTGFGTGVTPRCVLSRLLQYARRHGDSGVGAKAVVMDLDVLWRDLDQAGEEALRAELKAGSAAPKAPQLVLTRQVFEPTPQNYVLPPTIYDDIVFPASNIHFADMRIMRNGDRVATYYQDGVCASYGQR